MPQRALTPNAISYNAATSACAASGQWQRALELLEGMPQRALTPDVISYNAATSACEKGGQWQRALEVLDGMPQRALKPAAIGYNATMSHERVWRGLQMAAHHRAPGAEAAV